MTKNKVCCKQVKSKFGSKTVQNTFSCAFPISESILKKLWMIPQDQDQSFSKMLLKIGNAQLNVFCTAFIEEGGTEDNMFFDKRKLSWVP